MPEAGSSRVASNFQSTSQVQEEGEREIYTRFIKAGWDAESHAPNSLPFISLLPMSHKQRGPLNLQGTSSYWKDASHLTSLTLQEHDWIAQHNLPETAEATRNTIFPFVSPPKIVYCHHTKCILKYNNNNCNLNDFPLGWRLVRIGSLFYRISAGCF